MYDLDKEHRAQVRRLLAEIERHMVSFNADILYDSTFRAVPYKTESFKFTAVRFGYIRVIDMDNRCIRDPFTDSVEVSF